MPTMEAVKEQLTNLDAASTLLGRREIKDLPNILWDDEPVIGAVQGLYGGGNGLLVATDRRLIFIDRKMLGDRVKVEDFPYNKVSSIQYELKIMSAKITIFASGNKAEIEQVMPKGQARNFCENVRHRIDGEAEDAATESADPTNQGGYYGDVLASLERLGKLHENGVLDDDEFKAEKQKILKNAH